MKFFLTSIFSLCAFVLQAQIDKIIPAKPVPAKLVSDYADILTTAQEQALESKLIAYDDSTSSQIAVVTIQSLEDYDISEYALALGRKWGIGGAEFSNGVLVLVSMDERKSRIEVGYGLEGAITDITARNILDNAITTNFKAGNYYRGLDQATDDLIKAAKGEYKAPANYGSKKKDGLGFGAILGILFLIMLFGIMGGGGRSGGGTMSGAGWILGSILSNASRGGGGGWSGGGGGGGGFGGFGGGGFGGGGASGSW